MKKLILHAREYAYPPINLPDEISEGYNVKTADYSSEAIDFIEKNKGIEAFVLGVIMPKKGVALEEVDMIFEEKRKHALESAKAESIGDKNKFEYHRERHSFLFDLAYKPLANDGFEVYDYLKLKGYVGNKPILFWTTQSANESRGEIYDAGNIVRFDEKQKVKVLGMPAESEQIISWFNRNVC